MQLLARLMDHVLLERGERTTIVVATSGDTGGAAVEAFRGRAQVDVVVLFPHGRISEVQRRMMTTAPDDNVHALAIEGTFDDCQALVKAMFNHHAFRDRVRLSGVNSINWARIVAQAVYYFTAAVALGAPHRKVAFTVPTGNFGDVFAGYVATRMGLPVDRLVVATNVNDILARTLRDRRLRAARRGGDHLAVDGHPGLVEFRAAAVRRLWARRRSRARADGLARAIAPLRGRPRTRCRDPRAVHRRSRRRGGDRRDHPRLRCARPAIASIRTPRSRLAVAEKETRDPSVPMVVLSTAHPAKFPDAVEAACGVAPALPDWLADLPQAAGARHRAAGRSGGGRTIRCVGLARRARRSRCMSVEVTRLPSGLSVVTDAHAASGDGLARRLGRLRQPQRSGRTSTAFRTCSSTWRSRAPSGAARGRSPRRSKRSAATSTPRPASRRPPITRACSRPTCRSRSTCWPTF